MCDLSIVLSSLLGVSVCANIVQYVAIRQLKSRIENLINRRNSSRLLRVMLSYGSRKK